MLVKRWIARAVGAAVLGGGLLALGSGAASAADDASVSARLGDQAAAQVRVCGVLDRCTTSPANSTPTGSSRSRVRVRVPGVASATVSAGASGDRTDASARASVAPRGPAATGAAGDASAAARPGSAAVAGQAGLTLGLGSLLGSAGGSVGIGLVDADLLDGTLDLDGTLTLDGDLLDGSSVDAGIGDVSASVPVTVCGNAVGLLGDASTSCSPAQHPAGSGQAGGGTSAMVPVTVCGNSAGILGDASGACQPARPAGSGQAGNGVTAEAPVTVCGNAVGVAGDSSAACQPSQPPASSTGTSPDAPASGLSVDTTNGSSDPLLGDVPAGSSVAAGVGDASAEVPVTVCGNSAGVLGGASGACQPTQPATSPAGGSGTGVGVSGDRTDDVLLVDALGGGSVDAGVGATRASAPVTVCGNAAGVLGDSSASCQQPAGQPAGDPSGSGPAGEGVTAEAPVTVCGNAVGLAGAASATCPAISTETSPPGTPPATDTATDTGTDTAIGTASEGLAGLPLGGSGSVGLTATAAGLTAARPAATVGSGTLPFTGAASGLLGLVGFGFLLAGLGLLATGRAARSHRWS
jgi:hypothetical protein